MRASSEFLIAIDRRIGDGLQQQVYAGVRRAILEGVLTPGTRVPSSRSLADELCVSRTTTLLAYEQLLAEGYLCAQHGAGTYVARELPDDLPLPAPLRGRHVRFGKLSRRGQRLADMPAPARRLSGMPRPFRLGAPALDKFPVRIWSQLVNRRLRSAKGADLDYSGPGGHPPLQQAVVEHVQAARGARCIQKQVFIVAGAQRGLQMVATALLDHGDSVWTENPGYPGARSAFCAAGARTVPVRVDDHGLDVAAAIRTAPHARMAYVTPSNQFPLGVPMTLPRRLALLKWASRNDAWVIEDDYDSEFRYGTRPLTCLQGLDAEGTVIYVGTFAKSVFPALRLGFVLVPQHLCDKFIAMRYAADLHPPLLEQMALADFIADGHYARHLRRMRAIYQERRDALIEAAETYCAGALRLRKVQTGLHAVADLFQVDEELVSHQAARRGIEVSPLGSYCVGRRMLNGLLLGFACSRPEQLRAAMRLLADSIEAARRQRPRRAST
jgi:GntR family transcriptional regulator/MocR family aminotransferase